MSRNSELENYKSKALSAAEDFEYGEDVLNILKNAKTEIDIIKTMEKARRNKWKW